MCSPMAVSCGAAADRTSPTGDEVLPAYERDGPERPDEFLFGFYAHPPGRSGWTFAVSQLRLALDILPPKTGVLVDLAAATVRGGMALAGLGYLCEEGVAVTIRGEPAAIGELRARGRLPSEHLVLQEAGQQ